MDLTAAQQEAVRRRGQDVCVVAGPGSGKTRVLIERFRWLVMEQGIRPGRILAVTFTEKAANEIKERLVRAFSDQPDLRHEVERAYVSTIDGFCTRLLKEHAIPAGLPPDFSIVSQTEAPVLLHRSAIEALDQIQAEQPEAFRELLDAVDCPDLAKSLIDVYESIRVAGFSVSKLHSSQSVGNIKELVRLMDEVLLEPDRLGTANQNSVHGALKNWARRVVAEPASFALLEEFDFNVGHFKKSTQAREAAALLKDGLLDAAIAELLERHYAGVRELLIGALQRLDSVYRTKKRALGGLDFGDLEEFALSLLKENRELRERVRAGFDQILMDELQDTNPLQWRLLEQLRRPDQFFGVGDINQAIYGFRHADPKGFTAYRDSLVEAGKTIDSLYENHRSRAEILDTVNRVFDGREGIEQRILVAALEYPAKAARSVEVKTFEPEEEAVWVAGRIRALVGSMRVGQPGAERPAAYKDVAILARSLNALENIEQALRDAGIPYFVTAGRTFFETREVLDLTHYLRVLANPRDEISLAGVLRSPLCGIRDETLFRMGAERRLADVFGNLPGHDTAAFPADDLDRLQWFRNELDQVRRLAGSVPADRLLARAIDQSDYENGLTLRARANVEKFLVLARNGPPELEDLLEEIDWRRDSGMEPEALPDESANVVQLMSMHGAKGLEFPIVFLPMLQRGTDFNRKSISFSPAAGFGVRWRLPGSQEARSDSSHTQFVADEEVREKQERNRLFYVAMTRAKEHLVLSYNRGERKPRELAGLIDGLLPPTPDDEPLSTGDVTSAAAAEIPEVLLPKPEWTGQFDSSASVTSIALFSTCPRKYYLDRYLGISPQRAARRGTPLPASELGLMVHSMLTGAEVDGASAEALELAGNFRASELSARASRATRVEREFDFLVSLEDVVVRGQIDLWFEEGGELVLADYKTDKIESGGEELLGSYALQLRLYALALEVFVGRLPDRAILYMLRPNRAEAVSLTAPDLAAARRLVRDFRDAQQAMLFPLVEGDHCLRCSFYAKNCPAGRSRWTVSSRAPSEPPSSSPAP